jgi:hypothetical protein
MPLDYATTLQDAPSPRNWFGVGVRLIGLWLIVTGIDELVSFANVILRLVPSASGGHSFLTHAIIRLVVGFVLMFSAAAIVSAAYSPAPGIVRERDEEPPVIG